LTSKHDNKPNSLNCNEQAIKEKYHQNTITAITRNSTWKTANRIKENDSINHLAEPTHIEGISIEHRKLWNPK
jgi:hypothetical protein